MILMPCVKKMFFFFVNCVFTKNNFLILLTILKLL